MTNLRQQMATCQLPRLESQMLWQHVLDVPRVWLIAHDTDPLPDAAVQMFKRLRQRRLAGEPMAHILGWREFMGHRFQVTPDVLIPRPDTELLVEVALTCLDDVEAGAQVLDMGTGSGAIAVSIALARPDLKVVATDASAAALQVAVANASALGAQVQFFQGSWYDALPAGMEFHLIVSNPPYIAAHDPHLQQGDLRFEPRSALTDNHNGLHDLRCIVQGAPARLQPGGALYLEHGWDQAQSVRGLLNAKDFVQVESFTDLAGIERVSGGLYN